MGGLGAECSAKARTCQLHCSAVSVGRPSKAHANLYRSTSAAVKREHSPVGMRRIRDHTPTGFMFGSDGNLYGTTAAGASNWVNNISTGRFRGRRL